MSAANECLPYEYPLEAARLKLLKIIFSLLPIVWFILPVIIWIPSKIPNGIICDDFILREANSLFQSFVRYLKKGKITLDSGLT